MVQQPPPPEPTPLDNLLAVAELEFNQQRGEELELELQASSNGQYAFLPEEQVASEVMSFDLGEPKTDEMFFERKTHAPERAAEDDAFQNDMVVHKDLFDTISEAHYLPELTGPHDEALLESLVEKGCEDNQILGQALDKLAHLVHGSGDYAEEEEDMLLGGAPVADIIDRLEQSLESPGRSSITAAQGLLHLHHIGDHLPPTEHQQDVDQAYMSDEVFVPDAPVECSLETLENRTEMQEITEMTDGNHLEYEQNAEKRLESDVNTNDAVFTESVPETHINSEEKTFEEQQQEPCESDHSDILPSVTNNQEICAETSVTVPKVEVEPPDNTDVNENKSAEEVMPINFVNDNLNELATTMNLEPTNNEDMGPTDLSIKPVTKPATPVVVASVAETTNATEDNLSDKSDEQPRDLSVHRRLPTPHASPRRIDIPRAPSRESDAMQSPQPSGIPAVPSSPEIFTMPLTKSKQTLFLETLLSSPSPKMYTSEVTITKQQCEPLNLGKHRKSASPTVSSCSDEMRKLNKEFGEPQEKKIKRESSEDLAKISKVFNKCNDDQISESKQKKADKPTHKSTEEASPIKQLHVLKTSPDFNIPDPLLIPKDKLNDILEAPAKEIPALLIQRPELRLPQAFAYPAVLQDPEILVVSLQQLENIIENDAKNHVAVPKPKETKPAPVKSTPSTEHSAPQPDQTTSQPKPIPSMDALAGDIDAATSAALNQMLWLPYLSQLEAMAACSQNMDFLKALNSSGYTGSNYPDLSQMFNPSARFMGQAGFPMMPPMDYDNRLQFAMWQEAMNQANASQRQKPSVEAQMKDLASKSSDVQNPYVHSTKNHQSKTHSAARTSPIAHNYNSNQRSMGHNPFLQGMYPGMNPNIRPNMPLPGLQIPYFNPNMMSQRSPRTGQQKSPTSPYYPNNNYLQSVKQSEGSSQRSGSSSSQESPRPRISVKSLHNLLEPTAAAASGVGSSSRRSGSSAALGRRREEPEVGSTTPLGDPPPHLPPHPHDPSTFHLWHPLFGNQKGYSSPWSWTTVAATGE
ncbi:uncharacterized protein LOC106137170 [Amyelois transitella]|uniref:uncharacterized protein LOC106137170 n=1 Tax=Amyelois transitella TaxID=680683 RepID=UPI002990383D|nr:uncharacterized protein LOC106137170 [Amyelois transitella]